MCFDDRKTISFREMKNKRLIGFEEGGRKSTIYMKTKYEEKDQMIEKFQRERSVYTSRFQKKLLSSKKTLGRPFYCPGMYSKISVSETGTFHIGLFKNQIIDDVTIGSNVPCEVNQSDFCEN